MTNLEKFEDEIKLIVYSGDDLAVTECDGEVVRCSDVICRDCKFHAKNASCSRQRAKWMQEEYEKPTPKVDWSKVPIDTPILVKDYKGSEWYVRYFAGYIGGKVCVFDRGATSENYYNISPRSFVKLAEQGDEE